MARLLPDGERLLLWTQEGEATLDIRRPFGIGAVQKDLPYAPIRLWDTQSGQLTGAYPAEPDAIESLDISPDGRWIAAGQGSEVRHIRIHRSLTGNGYQGDQRRYRGPTAVWIWDTNQGELVRKIEGLEGPVRHVRFVLGGTQLMTLDNKNVHMWDLETGAARTKLPAISFATSVELNEDGTLAALTGGGAFEVWDLETLY